MQSVKRPSRFGYRQIERGAFAAEEPLGVEVDEWLAVTRRHPEHAWRATPCRMDCPSHRGIPRELLGDVSPLLVGRQPRLFPAKSHSNDQRVPKISRAAWSVIKTLMPESRS